MPKRLDWSTVATGVFLLCAVAMTANSTRTMYERSKRPATAPWDSVSQWQQYAARGHRIGRRDAATTIVVFGDYQCPACKTLEQRLRAFRSGRESDVAVVFRHFPLPFHRYARDAALAAECAARQDRFAPYHEQLYDKAAALGQVSWVSIAATAGVPDTGAFTRCLKDSSVVATVNVDIADGTRLGVSATPTLLVDGEEYVGVPWDLSDIIAHHVARARR
jgi:protein-disulfide isomerase